MAKSRERKREIEKGGEREMHKQEMREESLRPRDEVMKT